MMRKKNIGQGKRILNYIVSFQICSLARALKKHSGYYAFCDTDGIAISYKHWKKLQEFFKPLNPFPNESLLKLEKENFDENRKKELVNILNSFFREGGSIIPQMLIITHQREIEDVSDISYFVTKKDGYSNVELVTAESNCRQSIFPGKMSNSARARPIQLHPNARNINRYEKFQKGCITRRCRRRLVHPFTQFCVW